MTDQFIETIRLAQNGNQCALAQLLQRYDEYICNVARRFSRPACIGLDDLIQEGRIAFMRALRRFRLDCNSTLIGYVSVVIKRRLIDVLRRVRTTERLAFEPIDTRMQKFEAIDIRDQIDAALEQMRPRHRAAIEAYLAGEWTRDKYDAMQVIQRILRHSQFIGGVQGG